MIFITLRSSVSVNVRRGHVKLIRFRKCRIPERHEAPGRHAIGDIEETGRIEFMEIREELFLNQLGVQLSDPVDGMASHHCEVRHPYKLIPGFLDDR